MTYEIYNTETEQCEGQQEMPKEEAKDRNQKLIKSGEPQRYIPCGTDPNC